MSKIIKTKIMVRNDTGSNWQSVNPVLGKGEIGLESDTRKFKFGDGITTWKSLGYAGISLSDIPLASNEVDGLMSKADYSKLLGIETKAQVNIIESISVNGAKLSITDKGVNVIVPTGTLANKNKVAQSDFDVALSTAFDALENAKHTHSNKDILDTIQAKDINNWNGKADKATTLAGYGVTDAYTKTQVDAMVSSVLSYKGVKQLIADLPATGNKTGDTWHVVENSGEYSWDGTQWQELGSTIDLTAYATIEWVNTQLALKASKSELAAKVDKIAGKSLAPDTELSRLSGMATGATKVEDSTINGNIKINGVENVVYTLPNEVIKSTDILVIDGGNSASTF